MNLARQVLSTDPERSLKRYCATAVAGTKPKASHQPHLAHTASRGCKQGFWPPAYSHGHPLLMPVLVQQTRRVQIQSVSRRDGWATVLKHQPNNSPKATQIAARTREPLEKPAHTDWLGHPLNATISGTSDRASNTQRALTSLAPHNSPCINPSALHRGWRQLLDLAADAAGTFPTSQSSRSRAGTTKKVAVPAVRAEFLVRELDLDGLMGALEFNSRRHVW